jgi:hypothetical protein
VRPTLAYDQFPDQIKNDKDNEGEKHYHDDQSEGIGLEISLNLVAAKCTTLFHMKNSAFFTTVYLCVSNHSHNKYRLLP